MIPFHPTAPQGPFGGAVEQKCNMGILKLPPRGAYRMQRGTELGSDLKEGGKLGSGQS